MPEPREPETKTDAELRLDLRKRPESLDHLTAKAELEWRASKRSTRIQIASVIIAAIAAVASACSAGFSAYSAYKLHPAATVDHRP
jgi:hypothetical protein